MEVSALLVEFDSLITVKSHPRIPTDAWRFPINVLWQEDLKALGQEFQNLALAHVSHRTQRFWICRSFCQPLGSLP